MLELIVGGARSGKSRFAETQALASFEKRIYIATAQAHDEEMVERIALHQASRGEGWDTIEAPLLLADALEQHADEQTTVLVDCLSLWLTNLLMMDDSERLTAEKARLLERLPTLPGHIILVSNCVGMGVVPMGKLSRDFVDESGLLEQAIAALSDKVTMVVAGLPMVLKQ